MDLSVLVDFTFFFFLVNYLTYVSLQYLARARVPTDTRVFKFLTLAFGLISIVIGAYAMVNEYISRRF